MASNSINYEMAIPEFLSGGGEMGKLIRSKDWSKTPLGSPDTWPQSLRTTVSLCLASNFPISIAWGPDRVQIYNDGYWPITGNMHPESMGQDFKECWFSAWPVIGQAFEEATLGKTSFLENQRIFLDRYGYKEETFFTLAFSPILDESGGVGGLFHPVIEQTQQTLAERRLHILHTIPDHTVNAKTAKEASALVAECLKDFALDIPFVLLYSIADDGKEANLESNVGVEADSPLAKVKIGLQVQHESNWPFTKVIQNAKAIQVDELETIFGKFSCGPYPEAPQQALIFPITLPGTAHNNYLLVTGVSSRRNLDEKYRLFYELLAEAIKNALARARAYEEERKKAEALAEIDKAKTVFFSNISHEFRTPLTLMLGSLEELLNKPSDEIALSDKVAIETSHRNALRLLRLVNNLLDFSRIEAGKVQAQYQLTDLAKYTSELASNFRSVVEAAGLLFQIKTDAVIQPVYIDKEMWEKIVLNLLSNAFKYTLKGSITISLTTENNQVLLKVKDTGVGIPEAELPKMFQRFHRVQNVVGRTHEGTGIGLSLVSELVKLHGGEIRVQSKEAEGSVFTVSIPTGKAHLPAEHISEKELDFTASLSDAFINEATTLIDNSVLTGSRKESFEGHKNAITVLVVDDNADMRAYIKNLLKKRYHVVTANNGIDALYQIKEHAPQLILSDVMMPVMDGIELLKVVKENVQTQNIPVILLSARAGEESKIEGYETGADDYLIKPFSAKELLARVASQLKTSNVRKQLQQQLQNILIQAPVAMCMFRGPTYIVEVANERMLELWGKTSGQIMNKPVFETLPDSAGQGFEELLNNVYQTGIPFIANEMPVDLIRKGKLESAFLNFVYEPLYTADGIISGIVAVATEITEQVIARKQIEASEKRFSNILSQSLMAIAIFKGPGMIVEFANDPMLKVLGKGNAVLNKPLVEGVPEFKDQVFPKLLADVYNTGVAYEAFETKAILVRNGIPVDTYFNFVYQPYRDVDDTVTGITVLATEVTVQVLAKQQIEESEKQFRIFADSIYNLAWIANADGWIYWYNQRWYDYTGTTLEEMEGWGWEKLHHPDHVKEITDFLKEAWKKEEAFELTFPLLRQGGEYRWFLTRAYPVKDTTGKIERWIGTSTDINEQKIKEQQKDEFISIASHEMKTPLTTAKGYIELLLMLLSEENQTAFLYANKANLAVERLNSLITELLDASKIQNGKLDYNISIFNFNEMVDDAIENIQLTAKNHSLQKTGNIVHQIKGDKDRLQQVMINLLNNAVKYSPNADKVIIKVEEKHGIVQVSVQDFGIGMSSVHLDKVFDRYYRVQEHAVHFQGLGIGLYISSNIIERHQGKMWVESEFEKGSTFYFTIPI